MPKEDRVRITLIYVQYVCVCLFFKSFTDRRTLPRHLGLRHCPKTLLNLAPKHVYGLCSFISFHDGPYLSCMGFIGLRLEAIASRLEAIASWVQAIASRLEAIANC